MARHSSAWLATLALAIIACGKTRSLESTLPGDSPGSGGPSGGASSTADAAGAAGKNGAGGTARGNGGSGAGGGAPSIDAVGGAPGGSAGQGATAGDDTGGAPGLQIVAELGEVAYLTADSTHLYALSSDGQLLSVSIAAGTVTQIGGGDPRPGMGVDGEHVYYCDGNELFSRVDKGGGSVEAAQPPDAAYQSTACAEAVLTDEHAYTVAYDAMSMPLLVRYEKSGFDAPQVVVGVTPHWHIMRSGDFLYWGDWNDGSYEFTRFSWLDDSHRVVHALEQEAARENDALRAVDDEHLYFERCSNEDHSCTLHRVPVEGGDSEIYAAHEDQARISYLALAKNFVYASRETRLYRFGFEGEAEDLWVANDHVRNLVVQGDRLYFSVDPYVYSLPID